MLIVDGHLDLAWNALQWNRDLERPISELRAQPGLEIMTVSGQRPRGHATPTVALPEMRRGRIALCFATLLARSTGRPTPHIDFSSPGQAYGVARGQLGYYRALERKGHVRIITDLEGLRAHMAQWASWDADHAADTSKIPSLGVVISMEGADPLLAPEELKDWWQAGLRLLGPAHYGPGRYAGGTGTEEGLTEIGSRLLVEMQRCKVTLDVTHLSDQAFWQALDRYQGPVLASHNNCRALVSHQRQFSDEQLKAVIVRDGVIGAVCDAWMLKPGGSPGEVSNEGVRLAHVVDHIDHVCQLAGSSRHAAIGSDLDGGFGREQCPQDLDTIADLQKIGTLLTDRGYSQDDVAAILHGNWLRLLEQSLAR